MTLNTASAGPKATRNTALRGSADPRWKTFQAKLATSRSELTEPGAQSTTQPSNVHGGKEKAPSPLLGIGKSWGDPAVLSSCSLASSRPWGGRPADVRWGCRRRTGSHGRALHSLGTVVSSLWTPKCSHRGVHARIRAKGTCAAGCPVHCGASSASPVSTPGGRSNSHPQGSQE